MLIKFALCLLMVSLFIVIPASAQNRRNTRNKPTNPKIDLVGTTWKIYETINGETEWGTYSFLAEGRIAEDNEARWKLVGNKLNIKEQYGDIDLVINGDKMVGSGQLGMNPRPFPMKGIKIKISSVKDSSVGDTSNLKTCENLLRNGDFEQELTGWKVVNFTTGATTEIVKENRNSYVKLSHNGEKDWNSIGQEIKSKLKVGEKYVVSFKYKIESNLSLGVRFGDSSFVMHSSFVNEKYGWDRLMIGNENWREDTFEFTVTEESPKYNEPMFAIYLDYYNTGNILIDDVIVAAKTSTCRAK